MLFQIASLQLLLKQQCLQPPALGTFQGLVMVATVMADTAQSVLCPSFSP